MCRSLNGCTNYFTAEDRIIRMIYDLHKIYLSTPFFIFLNAAKGIKSVILSLPFMVSLKVYRILFNRNYKQCFCSKILKKASLRNISFVR